jgi:hypothetical protein
MLASRYDNPMLESTISSTQGNNSLASGRYDLWGTRSQCKARTHHLTGMLRVWRTFSHHWKVCIAGPCSECGGLSLATWKTCIVGPLLRVWRTYPHHLEGMYCGAPAQSVVDSPSPPGRYVLWDPCLVFEILTLTSHHAPTRGPCLESGGFALTMHKEPVGVGWRTCPHYWKVCIAGLLLKVWTVKVLPLPPRR